MDGTTGGVHSTQPSEMKSLASWVAPTSPESAAAFTVGMATALLAGGHSSEGAEDSGALAEAEADWERFAGEVVTEVTGDIVSPVPIPKTLNLKSFRYTALSGNAAAAPVPTAKSTEITRANPDARRASLSPNRLSASLKSTQVSTHSTAPPAMCPSPHPSCSFHLQPGTTRAGSQYFMDPDEHEQSAEMRDPVLRPRALRYSVAYVPMPEDVAGRFMHRKGREEDAYRAACGREFHLDLFPPRLKVRPSPVLLPLRSPRAYFSFTRWQNSVAFSYAFDGDEDDDEADASDQRYRYRPGTTQPSARDTDGIPHRAH